MPTDDHPATAPVSPARPPARRRPVLFLVVTGVAVVAAVCTLTAAYHYWRAPDPTPAPADDGHGGVKPQYFRNWPKPDLVLVLSGQQHGYMLPCGCSEPQYGGLERRYNFLQGLKDRGWPVLALDLGDINQKHGPAYLQNLQGLLKYRYTMESLSKMPTRYADWSRPPEKDRAGPPRFDGYATVTFGEWETVLPLEQALGAWALNEPSPRTLSANLINVADNFPDEIFSLQVVQAEGSPLKVGVTAVTGPTVAEKIKDPKVRYPNGSAAKALTAALKEMDARQPDLNVLLYQGTLTEAKACARAFPQFQVILCLTDEDEPPSQPEKVVTGESGTLIVRVGHKGKHLGVVGINRKGQDRPSFELRYEMVTLDPSLATPKEKIKGHPVLDLMERYTQELKRENYLARYVQTNHPNQVGQPPNAFPAYVGSEKCQKCHPDAYRIWKASPHSHAYQTLVDNPRPPALRQYDPECIVCHTVGFAYKTGFESEQKTPLLKDVGCESCHGPCGQHVRRPNNEQWHKLINPWKYRAANEAARMKAIERDLCIHCHDQDNDVHWTFDKWTRGKIIHMTPKE